MPKTEIYFNTARKEDHRVPYVSNDEPIEYVCDGKEGHITFDGYFYVEDHAPPYPEDEGLEIYERTRTTEWLPKTVIMYVRMLEDEKVLEEHTYLVEIYKRVKHECTNKYGELEDDLDGEGAPMRVCFFPTDRQTMYFRVVETM